ncbi:MAG: alpha/beta hydrolase fold domain-containing protein [Rubripirellula sp.]
MISRTATLLSMVCVCVAAASQPPTSTTDDRLATWLKRFPQADTDGDGVLTQKEAISYRDRIKSEREATSKTERRDAAKRTKPSDEDVAYGPHPRNRFDVYLPESSDHATAPFPLLVYFHGGGFVAGDKRSFDARPYLEHGYAVVSGNYRFVDGAETLSPIPMHDAARLIQYLRANGDRWNLNTDRIAVSGSSAGAVITLWIGYHNDMANPSSDDPIERQSTRVQCLVPINGPTNLDPEWITPNMGGPKHIHGSFPKMFGAPVTDSNRSEVRRRIVETSPVTHASADDPPTLLIYSGANEGIPLPESATTGKLIHHAFFGEHLASRLKSLHVVHEFSPATDPRKNGSRSILAWLDQHLPPGEE